MTSAPEGLIRAADGVRLRTARWAPLSPIGTVVLLGGRGEFIEKYFEVVGELLSRGFAVAAMDWRGQGGSDRLLPNACKGHVDAPRVLLGTLVAGVARLSAWR